MMEKADKNEQVVVTQNTVLVFKISVRLKRAESLLGTVTSCWEHIVTLSTKLFGSSSVQKFSFEMITSN